MQQPPRPAANSSASTTIRLIACLIAAMGVARLAAAAEPGSTAQAAVKATDWSRDDAAHLLRRAAFGGTPQQIDALHALGREAAVEYLLSGKLPEGKEPIFTKIDLPKYEALPIPDPDPTERDQMRDLQTQARKDGQDSDAAKKLDALRRRIQQRGQQQERTEINHVRTWWIDRMLRTDRPLEEKMTLFWHNLFTSGAREVRGSKMLADQILTFHSQALGNYRKLTHSMIHDGAMLRYLNNDQNVKGKPNENLARELMELFTLGEGNGYTETDIKEVARALTGLAPGGGRGPGGGGRYGGGPVTMRTFMHDTGTKTIFGKSGNFGPDDVVDLIFSKEEPSKYLAKRLWIAFAYPDPSEADLAPIVQVIKDNKYDLVPALRALFTHPAFYGEQAKFALIKSPAEVAVGTMRLLGREGQNDAAVAYVGRQMVAMDQELLQPPNVRGWVGGDNWITAATLFTRYNTASSMVSGGGGGQFGGGRRFGGAGGPPPGFAPGGLAGPQPGQATPEQMEQRMRDRAAQLRGDAPANGQANAPAGGNANGPTNEQIEQRMRERIARMRAGGADLPSTRPAGAATQPAGTVDPRIARRQEIMQNPQMREQMMQQFAQRRGGGPGAAGGGGMAPIEPAKLFPKLDAKPTGTQVVDAAIDRFLQRPLHPEKRQALIAAIGEEPLKLGTSESDNRVRQVVTLVLSTPEYQLQ